jgi:hypothetical protein
MVVRAFGDLGLGIKRYRYELVHDEPSGQAETPPAACCKEVYT